MFSLSSNSGSDAWVARPLIYLRQRISVALQRGIFSLLLITNKHFDKSADRQIDRSTSTDRDRRPTQFACIKRWIKLIMIKIIIILIIITKKQWYYCANCNPNYNANLVSVRVKSVDRANELTEMIIIWTYHVAESMYVCDTVLQWHKRHRFSFLSFDAPKGFFRWRPRGKQMSKQFNW